MRLYIETDVRDTIETLISGFIDDAETVSLELGRNKDLFTLSACRSQGKGVHSNGVLAQQANI